MGYSKLHGPMKQCHACGSTNCEVIGTLGTGDDMERIFNRCNDCGYIGHTFPESPIPDGWTGPDLESMEPIDWDQLLGIDH